MPLFICRWQNGDFSAASAGSNQEALQLFSEVNHSAGCEVFEVDNFMVHFQLNQEAGDFEEMLPVRFAGFGEQTHRLLCQRMYPEYCRAISEIDKDRPQEEDTKSAQFSDARRLLEAALQLERKRQEV